MSKLGRPSLSKRLKKINYGFTASPQLNLKLKKIRGTKSHFIASVMNAVPGHFIDLYNTDPEAFISTMQSSVLSMRENRKGL
jgi:hypothetical protein